MWFCKPVNTISYSIYWLQRNLQAHKEGTFRTKHTRWLSTLLYSSASFFFFLSCTNLVCLSRPLTLKKQIPGKPLKTSPFHHSHLDKNSSSFWDSVKDGLLTHLSSNLSILAASIISLVCWSLLLPRTVHLANSGTHPQSRQWMPKCPETTLWVL